MILIDTHATLPPLIRNTSAIHDAGEANALPLAVEAELRKDDVQCLVVRLVMESYNHVGCDYRDNRDDLYDTSMQTLLSLMAFAVLRTK